jgi:hypothetical protein
MKITEAVDDTNLLGASIKDPVSFAPWKALMAAAFGLPLDPDQLSLYRACTNRTSPPSAQFKSIFMCIGRRGGKSVCMALLAVYLAIFRDWRPKLTAGERAVILLVAGDRDQARILYRYIVGILNAPILNNLIINYTADSLDLKGCVTIEVVTRSYRAVRGRSVCAALLDEVAFFRSDDSANPDNEVVAAIRPSMATFGNNAMLIAASSPYARRGVLWDAYRKYYGKDDPSTLVWQAPTRVMNPSVSQEFIDEEYERDPVSAAAEYGANFRSDIAAFVDLAVLESCTADGLFEISPVSNVGYIAFVDPSGGSSDSMTLAIAHHDDGVAVLDCVREVRAPFQPEAVVADFCQTLASYGISTVTGDRYAGEWPREQFSKRNVTYRPSEKVKSDVYRDMLPILNSRRCQLLDTPRLISQLHGLERRTARGGKDSIDHGPGAHDDLANAVAGAIVLASHHVRPMTFHVPAVGPGRSEYMADFVAGIFDPAGGGSSMPPGGYPFGSPEADQFAHLNWSPRQQ